MLKIIYNKALALEDLSAEEAIILYEQAPLWKLMEIANKIRYIKNPNKRVSWQIDRNVNYTNICISGCLFCNFHCKVTDIDKHNNVSIEAYRAKIKTLREKGGDQLLLQGGLHPKYDINYYKNLFRELKKIDPDLKLNALGPPEIAHIARISNLSIEQTLTELIDSGLDTLPGAGAEILNDKIRKIISPAKPSAKDWIKVMKCAHKLGMSTTATMVYGHIESNLDRIEHLITIRDIQKEKPCEHIGFRAFICWPIQVKGTKLLELYPDIPKQTPADYIRIVAISRIILNNIDHIQTSWLTVGKDTAMVTLHSGADDMGSIMIEENVVSSAGANNAYNAQGIQQAIKDAGFEPWLRDQQYNPRNKE